MNEAASPEAQTALAAHTRYLCQLTAEGGGRVEGADGAVGCIAVHDFPFLINAVFRTDPTAAADRVLDAGLKMFGPERGFEVVALRGRDDDLVDEGVTRRLSAADGGAPLQMTDGPVPEPTVPAGVEVRWVEDAGGAADVSHITEIAHQVYGFPPGMFSALFARPETVLGPDLHAVVLHRDGQPVATAQIHTTEGVAYVGWVAVVPDAGRLGLGTLVTSLVTNAGFDAGATRAVLMASPMGAPVYRRMGFRDVGEVAGVVVPAGHSPANTGA